MDKGILETGTVCVICDKIIVDYGIGRFTTIGLVCATCYPNYNKINKLLCIEHTKSLNVALTAVGKMFGHNEGE